MNSQLLQLWDSLILKDAYFTIQNVQPEELKVGPWITIADNKLGI